MLEIEIKAPCKDLARLESDLLKRGARDFGTLVQADVYYAHPSRDFGRTDEALRLRTENDLTVITYKGPKLDADSKTREEFEVSVANPRTMGDILERLGFRPVMRVSKHRKVYGIRGVSVCLDRVDGLGDFVEFEYQGEDLEKGKAVIKQLMMDVGVEGNERRSYLELIMAKGGKG
jgi:adenylate cyclase class 2